eukprot:15268675-Alexandrium_andersonii.AAC.1
MPPEHIIIECALHVGVIHGVAPLVRVPGFVSYEFAPWLVFVLLDSEKHGANDGTASRELLARGGLVPDELCI